VSAAEQILEATRASDRQRHETMTWIRHARREGRVPQTVCDARLESASKAVTTADLARLTSDLGTYDVTPPVRPTAVVLNLVIIAAAWEPVALSGMWWLILAVPVTLAAPILMWAFQEYVR
jgi:DUF1707 SHOCT-like domain